MNDECLGDEYESLQPVYSPSLVNTTFEPDIDEYYHYYRMVHYLHSDKVLEGLHLVFVELPKFKAKNLAEKKMQVLCLRFLTEIGRDGADEVTQDLLDNPQTGQALEIVRESAYSREKMAAYDGFWDYVNRKKSELADVKTKITKLAAERDAITKKLRQTVLNLKEMGLSVEQTVKTTCLSAAELDKLK